MTDIEIVTACYGSRYRGAIDGWSERLRRLSTAPITVLTLDGDRPPVPVPDVTVIPTQVASEKPHRAELPRLEHVIRRLEDGVTCLQIDLDVYLKRWVEPVLDLDYDFIVSREVLGPLSFPVEMADRRGFVMCCGFYVARPGSLPLCRATAEAMRDERYGEPTSDQRVMNLMLLDTEWTEVVHRDGGWTSRLSVTEYEGTRICVLDRNDIRRGYNVGGARFGNHAIRFLDLYARPDLAPDRPKGRRRLFALKLTNPVRQARKRANLRLRAGIRRARGQVRRAAGRVRRAATRR